MIECGVPSELFSDYNFSDLNWMAVAGNSTTADLYGALARICVKQGTSGYLVKDKFTGAWVPITKRDDARNHIFATYGGPFISLGGTTHALGKDSIDSFLRIACPVISGHVCIPFADRFVIYNGQKRLNSWRDTIKRGDGEDIAEIELFLKLVRESLCGKSVPLDLSGMIDALLNRDPAEIEFRFVMNWLAAIYQRPGINLQTNLWFLGETKGVGKGTLIRVLRLVFGAAVGKAAQNDMERGWNDFIDGKLIIEADEFKASSKVDFNRMIKRDTTNPEVQICARGMTPYEVPNIGNWLFTTNEEYPIIVEDGDRRNTFIKTTTDAAWKAIAIDFNTLLTTNERSRQQIASGFAFLLDSIAVEWALIATAIDTTIKDDNRESSKNAVEEWLLSDDDFPRGEWVQAERLFSDFYTPWRERYARGSALVNLQQWGREMTRLARRGQVEKESKPGEHNRYRLSARIIDVQQATAERKRMSERIKKWDEEAKRGE